MPSILRTTLIAFLLTAASITRAQAQTTWPQPGTHADYGTLEIVTLANPGIRHYCRVHAITPDAILCGVGAARKPVLYHRDDIAAILDSGIPNREHSFVAPIIGGAVTAVIVATAVIAPWVALAIAASAISYATYAAISPHTSWHAEHLLYQRPNTPLTIKLRS